MNLFICVLALTGAVLAEDTDLQQLLDEGNTQFTTRMFWEVVRRQPDTSMVMSAFSVMQPLAQLSMAATGDTHDHILAAIGLPDDNVSKQVFPLVNSKLRSIKGVELKAANRIYIPINYELQDEFSAISRDIFGSEVKNVDFNENFKSAEQINKWVEEQTNDRIKDLVDADSLGPNTRAILVNALYFKGQWKNKFSTKQTKDSDFFVTKNKTVKVPTMFQKEDFRYGESKELDAKLLEMPYDGSESSFVIILPNDVEGLQALEEKIKDPSVLEKAMKDMFTTEVEVYIPKFKIETKTDLKAILENMGLKSLFTPGKAGLDKLLKGKEELYISEAIQKAFIEVSEEGVEAAAANELSVAYLSAIVGPTYVFNANHPFVFLLRQQQTTLFNGVYYA